MLGMGDYECKDEYHKHLLDLYLHLAQATQDLMTKREQANRFFITVSAALLAGLSWIFKDGIGEDFAPLAPWVGLCVCLVGLGLSLVWMLKLAMYRRLSAARFQVIQDLEALLPFDSYTREWRLLQDPAQITHDPRYGRRRWIRYLGLTYIERLVPILLCLPYLVLGALLICDLTGYWPACLG